MENKQENTVPPKNKITNLQTQEIPHGTSCVVFGSICCTLRCLQYFGVQYIGVLIASQLQIKKFFLYMMHTGGPLVRSSHDLVPFTTQAI